MAPTGAGAGVVLPVSGQVTCNADGTYTILWTLDNTTASPVTITSATLSGPLSGPVAMSPTTVDPGEISTGTTDAPGDTVGPVVIFISLAPGNASGTVPLLGDCVPSATTTVPTVNTTTTTTTPRTAAAAVAVNTAPTFTG